MTGLAERIVQGDRRAAARLMRLLDDRIPAAYDELKTLFPHTGKSYIVGITGSPGSGKSTLTNQLVKAYRQRGKTVGVVAIDPTSPFSGGAILGDRVRMHDHETDPGVFIRSLATRGNLGGLSRSTRDVIHVLEALGKDVIIVETVGVGQDEVDIVGTAHTAIVVLVPGMGDDIQAIKAGILEIADVFLLNKSDREGADRAEREIRMMIELGGRRTAWDTPIVRAVATEGKGVLDLADAIERHRAWLRTRGEFDERMRRSRDAEFWDTVRQQLRERAEAALAANPELQTMQKKLWAGEIDPYSAADRLLSSMGQGT